ncbi:Nitrogenase iron protein 1 [compost metagenome]
MTVTQSELQGKTTIEAAPDSQQARVYKELARKIDEHEVSKVPAPLEVSELREWAAKWGKQLVELENGVLPPQAVGNL